MSILGFPNEAELSSMMGYVTEEDREKWDRMKAASDSRLEASRNGLTARGLASQAAMPAMSIAERSINAELHAARNEEARKTQVKETKRTVTTFTKEEPVSSEEYGPGY